MLVALLGALIAIQVVKRIGALPAGLDLALALAAGLALAWALVVRRARVARTFVTVLSPGSAALPRALPARLPRDAAGAARAGGGGHGRARARAPRWSWSSSTSSPLTSLLGRDGRIDRVRYPNFATLAARSTWYSRATTVSDYTTQAVPAILDGRRPREGLAAHARPAPAATSSRSSAGSYRLNVSEEATHLCPRVAVPERRPAGPRAAAALAGLRLRRDLRPPGRCRRRSRTACRRSRRAGATSTAATRGDAVLELLGGGGRPARFEAWVRSIRPSPPPALNFKHVLLPHVPYAVPPRRPRLRPRRRPPARAHGPQAANDPFLVRQRYQRHLLQVGFTDRLLGRLIARLRETGLWDRALVVVTADHGVSFRVGQADRRAVTPENVEDIAPVPLFVKAPGQRTGRVSTRPVQTIDILPTIADELGIRRCRGGWTAARPTGPAPAGRPAVDMLTRAWRAAARSTPPSSSAACAPRWRARCASSARAAAVPASMPSDRTRSCSGGR